VPVEPGTEAPVPVSVLLTCAPQPDAAGPPVATVHVRRADGSDVVRTTELRSTRPLEDVADTRCSVAPDTRDRELSGPLAATHAPGAG
jgi:hypothetical protein